jgi:hypothetical protein
MECVSKLPVAIQKPGANFISPIAICSYQRKSAVKILLLALSGNAAKSAYKPKASG